MTNPYYTASGTPATSSVGSSAPMRSEFTAIQAGFDKFPDFSAAVAGSFYIVNSGLTGVTTTGAGMKYDSGNLGIGMVPVNVLDISKNTTGNAIVSVKNANAGGAATARLIADNGTSSAQIIQLGASYSSSGINRANGMLVSTAGVGGITINTLAAQPIYFGINSVEKMRLTANGSVLVNSTVAVSNELMLLNQTSADAINLYLDCSANTPGQAVVCRADFKGSTPNDTTAEFLQCIDFSAARAILYSNGGLANFSANNVNLSDARVKATFQRYEDAEFSALETSFLSVDWGKFKYDDQSHDDWNHGYTAQGVAAAFVSTAPELVDYVDLGPKDGPKLKGVYETDLTNIGLALLARALKRIEHLELVIEKMQGKLA